MQSGDPDRVNRKMRLSILSGGGYSAVRVATVPKEVSQMSDHESELELELEQTFGEEEMEDEAEGEGFLGGLLGE